MNDTEAAKEFWKDYVVRLTMGKPLLDPYQAGLAQGRAGLKIDDTVVILGLEKLVGDSTVSELIKDRAHKMLHNLRGKDETNSDNAVRAGD
jgi:hypothetical protein